MPALEAMTVGVPGHRGQSRRAAGGRRRRGTARSIRTDPDALATTLARSARRSSRAPADARGAGWRRPRRFTGATPRASSRDAWALRGRARGNAAMADRALHIGIDGRELVGQPTGVGRYLLELLRAGRPSHVAASLHGRSSRRRRPCISRRLRQRFAWVVDPAARGRHLVGADAPAARARARATPTCFFAAGYTAPLRLPCPFVVAIYDVSFFAHPEWFGAREGLRRRWLTRRGRATRARAVVTISEFSASEIVRWLGRSRARRSIWRRLARRRSDAPPRRPRASPSCSSSGRSSTAGAFRSSLQAFALARERVPDARLVLVGDNRTSPRIDPRAIARVDSGIADRVEWREYVPDAELDALYDRARVFAFLSDYEGFGMTPLEAHRARRAGGRARHAGRARGLRRRRASGAARAAAPSRTP